MIFTTAIALTLALVSAAPLDTRQMTAGDPASKIVNDMQLMSTDLATLQAFIDPFTGTEVQELEMEQGVFNLNQATLAATQDIEASPAFDPADSARLTIKLDGITPVIVAAIKALGTKAPIAATVGYTSSALSSLQELETSIEAFYAALEPLMNGAANITDIKANKVDVDAVFDTVIRLYE